MYIIKNSTDISSLDCIFGSNICSGIEKLIIDKLFCTRFIIHTFKKAGYFFKVLAGIENTMFE